MLNKIMDQIGAMLKIKTDIFFQTEENLKEKIIQLNDQAVMLFEKEKSGSEKPDLYWQGMSEGLRIASVHLSRQDLALSDKLWFIANKYHKTDEDMYFGVTNCSLAGHPLGQGAWRIPGFGSKEEENRFYLGAKSAFGLVLEAARSYIPDDFASRDSKLSSDPNIKSLGRLEAMEYIIGRSEQKYKLIYDEREERLKRSAGYSAVIIDSFFEEEHLAKELADKLKISGFPAFIYAGSNGFHVSLCDLNENAYKTLERFRSNEFFSSLYHARVHDVDRGDSLDIIIKAKLLEEEKSAPTVEEALYPGQDAVATTLSNLALRYCSQFQYEKAEPLFKRALALKEQAFGPDHPEVAICLNHLAWMYFVQDGYSEAEPLRSEER